jgi:hypothetical protein
VRFEIHRANRSYAKLTYLSRHNYVMGSGLRGAVSLDVAFESWRRRSIRVLRRQFGLMQTRIRI